MKRILFLMLAVVLLAGLSGLSGCCCNRPAASGGNCLIDGSCGTCADTCQPSDCGDCGTCDQGYECVQGGQCVQGCEGGGCGQGLADRCRGFLSSLCPWGHGGGHQAAAPAGDGAFGQGTGGVVAYPYYTTRGPRDFLAKNPRSIGP